MKVKVEIDVFGDLEFCYSFGGHCDHLKNTDKSVQNYCQYFRDSSYDPLPLEFHKMQSTWIKCDQCKEAYEAQQ